MSDSDDLRFSEMRAKRGQSPPPRPPEEPTFTTREFSSVRTLPPPPSPPQAESDAEEGGGGFKLPVDRMRIVAAIKRRWLWIAAAACVGAGLGFAAGGNKSPYKINVTFIRPPSSAFDSGLVGGAYRPEQLSIATLANLTKSPELIHRVALKSKTPISESGLRDSIEVNQAFETELITVTLPGESPLVLLDLATNYISEVLLMGRELQVSGTVRMNQFYKDRIKITEKELNDASLKLNQFKDEFAMIDPEAETQSYVSRLVDLNSKSDDAAMDLELMQVEIEQRTTELARQNPLAQKLAEAQAKLFDLRLTLTDEHPSVKGLRKQIEDWEAQLLTAETNSRTPGFSAGNSPTNASLQRLAELKIQQATLNKKLAELAELKQGLHKSLSGISTNRVAYLSLKGTVESLKNSLTKLTDRQREAQLYEDEAQGYFKLVGRESVDFRARLKGLIKFTLIGFIMGALVIGAVVAGIEVLDDSLKTAVDVERVTGLPLLASLGDLNSMSAAEKDDWAFRTWTALSGQLSPSPNHGMVCGFISSLPGEGRSTWINLLVNAAGQRGFRVLTVATRPPRSDPDAAVPTVSETERQFGNAISQALAATRTEAPEQVATLTPQALAFPAEVTRQLTGPNAPPVAHIPLPGWVWNLERRKQWQSALAHWRAIDNLVLLVELPPASVPESVLLAENLPQLIWLVDSGRPRTRATRGQLETLRYAKCRLVGAVLNHEPKPVLGLWTND